MIEIDPVERIGSAPAPPPAEGDYVLQARGAGATMTLLVDRSQLELLSASIVSMLSGERLTGQDDALRAADVRDDHVDWRVGRILLGFDEDRRLFFLDAEELADDEADRPPASVRLWVEPRQMLALAEQASELLAQGLSRCQLCGNARDPAEHVCPALNGQSGH
ncbi:MAG TPA: DUF3090 family protein [Actinomycetota bacterium]|nr:DUF3090 family protein [Actinomycetota bacterium]